MNAMKNLLHAVILAIWAVMGTLFTLKCLFGAGPGVFAAGSWWLWFIGFAGLTTFLVSRFKATVAAPLVHGTTYLLLLMLPQAFPLSVFRMGIDLLGKGA